MAGVCQQRGMVSMAIKAEDVLKAPKWPPLWPFVEADFRCVLSHRNASITPHHPC